MGWSPFCDRLVDDPGGGRDRKLGFILRTQGFVAVLNGGVNAGIWALGPASTYSMYAKSINVAVMWNFHATSS